MATDRSLAALLRALQSPADDQDSGRILGSTTALLTLLSNPLNVTLLVSQILTAPAIWARPEGLPTSLRILSVFNSAAVHILDHEEDPRASGVYLEREGLPKEEWVRAVIKGADEKSSRWKHLLVLGGLLAGFSSKNRQGLPGHLRRKLESAVVNAANLALRAPDSRPELATGTVCLVLGLTSDLLSDFGRSQVDHNRLLPALMHSLFMSGSGLHCWYLLSSIDHDVIQMPGGKLEWPERSPTWLQLQDMSKTPLISALGQMARLTAHSVGMVSDTRTLLSVSEVLITFSKSTVVQWRQNKLSGIDMADDIDTIGERSRQTTLQLLWQMLKSTLLSIVTVQRALLGRLLGDNGILSQCALSIATESLHVLRNFYFVSSRFGHTPFAQYTFVYMAAIDTMNQYSAEAEAFLRGIRPAELGNVPCHALNRCYDLFFLNLAEHFTTTLSPTTNEELLIGAATPYLATSGSARLSEIFEAAHSVMLSVFSAPQNCGIALRYLPFYVDVVFQSFPSSISGRQFRLAMKTLIRVASPPSPVAEIQPLLSSTLMQTLLSRSAGASPMPLLDSRQPSASSSTPQNAPISEQSTLVLALIDSLPFVSLDQLEEWLPLAAGAVHNVRQQEMKSICQMRLWEVLESGEMDVARSQICVIWWNERGGREMVLRGRGLQSGEDDDRNVTGEALRVIETTPKI